jgi:hypothetical protein
MRTKGGPLQYTLFGIGRYPRPAASYTQATPSWKNQKRRQSHEDCQTGLRRYSYNSLPQPLESIKFLGFQVPQKTPPRAEVDAHPLNGREAGEGNAIVRLPMMSTTPSSPNLVNDAPRLRGPAAGG